MLKIGGCTKSSSLHIILHLAEEISPNLLHSFRVPSAFVLYGMAAGKLRDKLSTENPMCRNIKNLFNFDPPVTSDEVRNASLQFVRKISGFHAPSKANEAAFHAAINEITSASMRLLASLETSASPKNREAEAAKAKARSAARFSAA